MAADCRSALRCSLDKRMSRPSSKPSSTVSTFGVGTVEGADAHAVLVAIAPITRSAFGSGCDGTGSVR